MNDRFRTGHVDWEDVRFFAALARHGSLSATARALRVNHATVSRRIAALEQALQTILFKRRPSGYELTAAGRRTLEAAEAMESAAAALHRHDPERGLTGPVRITATPALAETFLIPRSVALHRQYPQLELEITAERRTLSLRRHQSDLALRFGRPQRGELSSRRVASATYRFYGTPAWRSRMESGAAPGFVGFDEAGADFPEALWLARQFGNAALTLRCNNLTGQVAAARAGLGIAMLPHFLAARDPGLVEIGLSKALPARELWLVTRRDAQTSARIRVVVDFLVDLFHRERSLFEGG